MDQFFESGDYNSHHSFYASENRASSEWSASSYAGTPMTRDPSTGSATTTYSDEIIQSPSSEHAAFDSPWSPVHVNNYDSLWSPTSDSSHDMTFPSTSYNFPYTPDATERWWVFYDFVADVEPGQQPYWRLRPGLPSTDQFPATRVVEESPRSQAHDGMFFCMFEGCPKSFRRKADLDRHIKQIHIAADKREKYPCDWKRCIRSREPFHRRDHQREHLRDFHHEDLMRRGSSNKEDEEWWRQRKVNPEWWRCARCLGRVKVEEDGYVCPVCRISCEPERQYFRSR
ncbi:hypothetical protein F5Y01DRAFT_143068 [Xylaria sp. FL0043]|nr:hypothetical protein F5Y01DRAFT_143068 [Xylaria sp. FL0043]